MLQFILFVLALIFGPKLLAPKATGTGDTSGGGGGQSRAGDSRVGGGGNTGGDKRVVQPGDGGKGVLVPDAMIKAMKSATVTADDFIALKDIGRWLACEAWWYGFYNGSPALLNAANGALSVLTPGWNGSKGGTVIDGEGPKVAYCLAQFKLKGGNPNILKPLKGLN